MDPAISFRSILALIAAIPVAACQTPQLAVVSPKQELVAYVVTPAHQTETVKVAQTSGRWQMSGCTNGQSFSPSQITYAASPMSFAPDGTPLRGIWMEQIIASGCGRNMLLNVAWIMGNGRISAGSMALGATRADPLLQTDAARNVVLIAEVKARPCAGKRSFIYDTVVDPAVPGAAPGSWSERWTISSCNKHITVPISFTPDGKGGSYFAVRGDAAVIE